MGPHITTIPLSPIAQLLLAAALPAAGVIKAWIGYRRAVAVERWRTRRLVSALRSVGPAYRADVITACAQVEAASSVQPGPPGGDQPLQVGARKRWLGHG
jgi:hypothetical protein